MNIIKKITSIVLLGSILIIFKSCQEKNTDKTVSEYLKINVNIEDVKIISATQWFSSVELIPLETNEKSLIGQWKKIIFHEGKFFILDRKQDVILVYNANGDYVSSSLSKKGHGPEEYMSILDFDISKETNTIEILDASSYKIKKYDTEFNYLNNWILPQNLLPFSYFKILPHDKYAFYYGPSEKDRESIRIFSANEKRVIKKLKPHPFFIEDIINTQGNPFYEFNNQLFFTYTYPNNESYKIELENWNIKKVVEYNFGKYTFTPDVMQSNRIGDFFQNNRSRYVFITNKYENKKDYLVFTYFKDDMYIIKYDKQTKSQEAISWKFSDGGMLLPPAFIDNDFLYIITENQYLSEVINQQLLSKTAKKILNQIKEDDNPVMIRYKFQNVK
jgi:hypothetical protein